MMNGWRDTAGADPAPRPAKKQRQQRPSYSCTECRRLKMKCDRRVPCSNCVRRHRSDQCHGASNNDRPAGRSPVAHVKYGHQKNHQCRENHQTPQSQVSGPGVEHTSVGSGPVHDYQALRQQFQPQPPDPAQPQVRAEPLIPAQTQRYNNDRQEEFNGLDQLAALARGIDPASAQRVHPQGLGGFPPLDGPRQPSSAPRVVGGADNSASQPVDEDDHSGSYGTLMFSEGGRSKYLGPTAGSEWLKNSETREISVTPTVSRAPSPEIGLSSNPSRNYHADAGSAPITFPFSASQARISTRELLSRLPSREEAWILAESYYRYRAWHHDVAPKMSFKRTFDRVYKLLEEETLSPPVNSQEIALVYMIMAQGTLYNIEMPYNDPSAEEWLYLSERALVKGDFLATNTIHGLQTLNLMAHHHLELDKGRRGDNAWPLWGLVMRLIQAMGMHRDGTRWSLPENVVEERRRVFWECNAADVFQAHCFSRPCAINPEHCDTAFPTEVLREEQSYTRLRYELSQLSSEILNMAMKVRRPKYSAVTDLDLRLCEFERSVPFSLRCRAAFLSMPSRFPRREEAIEASPEPSKRSIVASFQQTNLSLNISETIINLHRPYYAKALYEDLEDPVKSQYAPSFLTVIERCSIIIAIVTDIHARFPAVSTRQWNLWYHVFNSALCLGTLVLRNPRNPLAPLIIAQLDASVCLFTSLIQHGASIPRYHRNLQGLLQLRTQATSKIPYAPNDALQQHAVPPVTHQEEMGHGCDDGEDVELIGWRTRLVERAGQDRRTIKTISVTTTPNSASDMAPRPPPNRNHLGDAQSQFRIPEVTFPLVAPDSKFTDDVLHNFWDPLLLDDLFKDPPIVIGDQG